MWNCVPSNNCGKELLGTKISFNAQAISDTVLCDFFFLAFDYY